MYCASVPISIMSVLICSNWPTFAETATSPPRESISCFTTLAVLGSIASNLIVRCIVFSAIICIPIGWTPILVNSVCAWVMFLIFMIVGFMRIFWVVG